MRHKNCSTFGQKQAVFAALKGVLFAALFPAHAIAANFDYVKPMAGSFQPLAFVPFVVMALLLIASVSSGDAPPPLPPRRVGEAGAFRRWMYRGMREMSYLYFWATFTAGHALYRFLQKIGLPERTAYFWVHDRVGCVFMWLLPRCLFNLGCDVFHERHPDVCWSDFCVVPVAIGGNHG